MKANPPILYCLRKIWLHITPSRRKQFFLLIFLALFSSLAEIFNIGAAISFIGILTNPENTFNNPIINLIVKRIGITDLSQIVIIFTIGFIAAILISTSMRLLLLWANTKISLAIGSEISLNIYRRSLYQPYIVHCSRNSSEIINAITGKSIGLVSSIFLPILNIINSSFLLLGVFIALSYVNFFVTLLVFIIFTLFYLFIVIWTRKKLYFNGVISAEKSTEILKILQEGLSSIRDVLIDGSQEIYSNIFHKSDLLLRRAQGKTLLLSAFPRYILEAFVMIFIACIACFSYANSNNIILIIGIFLISAQRILPLMQQIFTSWGSMQSARASLNDALILLSQPLPKFSNNKHLNNIAFRESLIFKKINFKYEKESEYILFNLNLNILKGSRVGFIGESGSGKSTLIDIIMGLLNVDSGTINIDNQTISLFNNKAWQVHIAHVPQYIFLTDNTIEENIAFGVPKDKIDLEKVRIAAEQSQLSRVIEKWPDKYKTFVGERGIRLSGGQRQRIGIARALYKQAEIIIFDEATNALDHKTEQAIMKTIYSLSRKITILIVAHRLSSLTDCDQVFEISNKSIRKVSAYKKFISNNT